MPIFDYRCTNCGHEYEEVVANPGVNPDCPNCHMDAVRDRLISAPSMFIGLPLGNTKKVRHPNKPKQFSTNKNAAKKRRKQR